MNPVAATSLLVWLVPSFFVSLWYVLDPLGAIRFFKKRSEAYTGFFVLGGIGAWIAICTIAAIRILDFLDEDMQVLAGTCLWFALMAFGLSYAEMKKKEQLKQEQNRPT